MHEQTLPLNTISFSSTTACYRKTCAWYDFLEILPPYSENPPGFTRYLKHFKMNEIPGVSSIISQYNPITGRLITYMRIKNSSPGFILHPSENTGWVVLLNPHVDFCWLDLPKWSYFHSLGLIVSKISFYEDKKMRLLVDKTLR